MPEPVRRLPTATPAAEPLDVPEVLAISALLDTGAFTPEAYGLTVDDLSCYQQVWSFATEYQRETGKAPPLSLVRKRFADFPYVEGIDVAWALRELAKESHNRAIRRAMQESIRALNDGDSQRASELLMGVASSYPGTSRSRVLSVFDEANVADDATRVGLPVPFPGLMEATGGLRPGELWYYAARTGVGKSWMLSLFAAHAAEHGARVGYASLEMPARQVNKRLLGIHARNDLELRRRLRSDDLSDRRAAQQLLRNKIPGVVETIDPSMTRISTDTVSDMAREYDLVVVDHVGLMQDHSGRRSIEDWRVAATISNALKETAVARDRPILAAAQINREGDTGGPMPPKISQLSQTTALEQDGDVVVTMKKLSDRVLIHKAGKVREGPNRLWWSKFEPRTGEFHEIPLEEASELQLDDAHRAGMDS